ncbi:MAG: hypothetical protein ACI8WB_002273 [Phenylobacterium sp.]|jgi:uncharacterized protein YciI
MFLVDMNFVNKEKITPELTAQHQAHLGKEYQADKLMFGGRKAPRLGGVIVSKHSNETELRQVFDVDPLITSGAANYSITEFEPVMAPEKFEFLFA